MAARQSLPSGRGASLDDLAPNIHQTNFLPVLVALKSKAASTIQSAVVIVPNNGAVFPERYPKL
jgi:hypothetical protein